MQTQTSNTLHNAIMEAGSKDRPPMLAPSNYVQWKSIINRYIDTKPNHELIHYCLTNPPYKLGWIDKEVLIFEGSPITRTEKFQETYKNVSQDIHDQLNAEAEAVQIILTGIDNDIYSIVDACPNASIVNSPQPIYDQEPSMVAEDDEMSMDKEIDKLMALISLSFMKIYKPTNNNLRTSSNTSRANQDNSPRINRSVGYENQRIVNVAGARETVEQADWRDDTDDDELEDQELEAHYMYMAQLQEVSPDAADSGPIFDVEPLQKVSNNYHYNVFAIKSEHPDQSESIYDTYPIEQDAHIVTIDSLDISYDREEIDQNDDDNDLANERELLASLIEKLKCEIDESKNRNKFLETSKKVLIENLKDKLFAHQETISILSQQKEAQIKLYKTHEDKELDKVIALENKVKVLDNIVYKTGQSVQTMNMLNKKCRTSFAKPEFLKKAKRANPRMYDIDYPRSQLETQKTQFLNEIDRLSREYYNADHMNAILGVYTELDELVEIVLFIVDSGCSKHMTRNLKLLINFVEKFLGTVKFKNDQIAPILEYGDLVQGAITIKRVYYVEGLNHNLFSVGQFCNANLEVASRKSTCYICDLKGNDLLTGSRGTDLYLITLQDTNCPNPICLMAKATSSQAWLWHRRLSHLNFDTINLLSKKDIVRCYIVRDGENLDKMKEKGDACIFVGYSTQSRAYSVFNKRTRVIVETIDVNFDELPQMASDHVSSDPAPECQRMALEHGSLSPSPQCQENVTQADKTVTTSNELDLLFRPMFDELLNGSSKVVSNSSVVSTVDAPNQRQHHTTPLNNHTTPAPTYDEFINIFCTPVQDQGEMSSRHVDSSNMHTFYQRYPSEHRWKKDHPLEQVIRNPSQSVRTRRKQESDGEMCMFVLTVSRTEPKNIKEAMADSAWIESMQEEHYQFDRLEVWELVDRPLCTNVINLKWLWKNKRDEENTVI
nr:integrase, catalytic region, zinc finger, CCHC-type, peptidase aspartic, catalytic [Tanacetum cinerariifolium]